MIGSSSATLLARRRADELWHIDGQAQGVL